MADLNSLPGLYLEVETVLLERSSSAPNWTFLQEGVVKYIFLFGLAPLTLNEYVPLAYRAVKQRLVEQSKEDAIQHISAKLLGESVESSVYNLAREAISEETERRDAALKALGEEIRRRRTLVLFKK